MLVYPEPPVQQFGDFSGAYTVYTVYTVYCILHHMVTTRDNRKITCKALHCHTQVPSNSFPFATPGL